MGQPQPKQTKKILRIGIIQGGKIIEERLLRKREPVTVGESHRNTFVIPATGLPPRFPLFELKGDKYFLTIAEWMDGRLSLGSGVSDLQGLKKKGIARQVGQVDYQSPSDNKSKKVGVYQAPLTERSRGKLTFGEITLLFQFVTPPPLPVKPQLPAIIQGGWIKGVDWVYSSILLVSFIAHTGFIYWARMHGELSQTSLSMIDDRFAKEIIPPKPRMPDKPAAKRADPKANKKKGKKKKAGKKKKRKARKKPPPRRRLSAEELARQRAEAARRRAVRRRKIQQTLMKKTLLQGLIGSKGGSGAPIRDLLAGGAVYNKNLDAALKNVDGISVSDGSTGGGTRRSGGGGGKIGLKAQLRGPSGGGGPVGRSKGRKRIRIRSSLKISSLGDQEGGKLNAGKLMRMIQRRSGQFKYCYERELKSSPSLQGKLKLRITIALNGRVSETEVDENSLNSRVASCIIRKLKRWRYPKPQGEAATVVIPFFFAPSG